MREHAEKSSPPDYCKYLTAEEMDERWGFNVVTAGHSRTLPRQTYPKPAGHPTKYLLNWNQGRVLDSINVIYIVQGRGVFESDFTPSQAVSAGTCFLLFPGMWHRYKPDPDSGWEEYWVGFRGPYADYLLKSGLFAPNQPFIDVGMNEQLPVLFRRLLETIQQAPDGYEPLVAGTTLQLLGTVLTASRHNNAEHSSTERLIAKARYLLQTSMERPVNVEALAGELPMGYSLFRREFKRLTGVSPAQYQLRLRLGKAKELLLTTSLSVSEVAYYLGFESLAHFSKQFKKKYGFSPRQLPKTPSENPNSHAG